jgi:hypothetical protein
MTSSIESAGYVRHEDKIQCDAGVYISLTDRNKHIGVYKTPDDFGESVQPLDGFWDWWGKGLST